MPEGFFYASLSFQKITGFRTPMPSLCVSPPYWQAVNSPIITSRLIFFFSKQQNQTSAFYSPQKSNGASVKKHTS
jgi:hypothetical protein